MSARLSTLALLGLAACRSASASRSEVRASEPVDEVSPGVALIELYTSEGCSSCPPADRLLAELAASSRDRVYALSFHVDYWNDLGWADPFSSGMYTDRQQAYARALGLRGLYTPQMIVNGSDEFTGSDRNRAEAAIARALSTPPGLRLAMHPRWTAPDTLAVDFEVSRASRDAAVFLAVAQREAVTSVGAGENAGRTLRHENVVRALASVPLTATEGSVSVKVPSSLAPAGTELVGWVQNSAPKARDVPVLGAARASLPER
jgi:hypothetical protein